MSIEGKASGKEWRHAGSYRIRNRGTARWQERRVMLADIEKMIRSDGSFVSKSSDDKRRKAKKCDGQHNKHNNSLQLIVAVARRQRVGHICCRIRVLPGFDFDRIRRSMRCPKVEQAGLSSVKYHRPLSK